MRAQELVEHLKELRDLDRAALLERLKIPADKVQEGVDYERLHGLAVAYDPARSPARFYLRGDALVMIYLRDDSTLAPLLAGKLVEQLGAPALKLRSRAGKKFKHYAYPALGVAFTFRKPDDPVRFLEVFPNMSSETYLQEVYEEPPPFRK